MDKHLNALLDSNKEELLRLVAQWQQQYQDSSEDTAITLLAKQTLRECDFASALVVAYEADVAKTSMNNILNLVAKACSSFLDKVLDPSCNNDGDSLSDNVALAQKFNDANIITRHNLTVPQDLVLASKVTMTADKVADFDFAVVDKLQHAMRYSVLASGKMLRPALVFITGLLFNSNVTGLLIAASALECVHAYSLIHDDLPAMDDDDFRRGRLSNHKVFDQAHAILAGDSLQSLAFTLLANNNSITALQQLQQVAILADRSGHLGMCLGQSLDILSSGDCYDGKVSCDTKSNLQGNEVNNVYQQLLETHLRKTGCLINASALMGLVGSDLFKDSSLYQHLSSWAYELGLLFQIKDDLLDVTGNQEDIGKPVGSDLDNNKITFTTLMSIAEVESLLDKHYNACCRNLNFISDSLTSKSGVNFFFINWLRALTKFVVERKK